MQRVQFFLNKAQAVPVVGPVFVSPVKAVVSIAQTITAIAACIFFNALTRLTKKENLALLYIKSQAELSLGFFNLAYSIINMLTLGIIGYKKEFAPASRPTPEFTDLSDQFSRDRCPQV